MKRKLEYAFTITEDITDDVDTNENEREDSDEEDEEINSDEEDEKLINSIIEGTNNNFAARINGSNSSSNNNNNNNNSNNNNNNNNEKNRELSMLLKRQKLDLSTIEIKEPKFVKPFDYDQMREEQCSRGVIFVQKPMGRDLINRFGTTDAIRKFFAEFGTVLRVAPEYEFRNKKRHLAGFFVEYESKSIAENVALSVNGAPISRRDSRILSVRYVPDFNWASIGENEEKKKMYQKMMRLEAEKELRTIKRYKRNIKMAEKEGDNKAAILKKNGKLKFKQHRFEKYNVDKNHHLNFLPIFNTGTDNNSSG
jgi:hypothetical protein